MLEAKMDATNAGGIADSPLGSIYWYHDDRSASSSSKPLTKAENQTKFEAMLQKLLNDSLKEEHPRFYTPSKRPRRKLTDDGRRVWIMPEKHVRREEYPQSACQQYEAIHPDKNPMFSKQCGISKNDGKQKMESEGKQGATKCRNPWGHKEKRWKAKDAR